MSDNLDKNVKNASFSHRFLLVTDKTWSPNHHFQEMYTPKFNMDTTNYGFEKTYLLLNMWPFMVSYVKFLEMYVVHLSKNQFFKSMSRFVPGIHEFSLKPATWGLAMIRQVCARAIPSCCIWAIVQWEAGLELFPPICWGWKVGSYKMDVQRFEWLG